MCDGDSGGGSGGCRLVNHKLPICIVYSYNQCLKGEGPFCG